MPSTGAWQRSSRMYTPVGGYSRKTFLIDKAVFDKGVDSFKAVLPVQFFPLTMRTGVIADGHFRDGVDRLPDLRGDLGTELEAPAFEPNRVQHFPPESLITRRFVRYFSRIEDVCKQVQGLNAEEMMQVPDLIMLAEKSVAEPVRSEER